MKQIKASNCDMTILVDDDAFDIMIKHTNKWSIRIERNKVISVKGYSKIYKRQIILSRILMSEVPANLVIDHIDRNPLNNQKSNLRIANKSQNGYNTIARNNKKYKGVTKDRRRGTYTVQIYYTNPGVYRNSKYCKSGFKTQIDAAKHANEKYKELHKEFAYQNTLE